MQKAMTRQAAQLVAVTRQHWQLRAVHRVLASLARAGNLAAGLVNSATDVEVIRDVPYGDVPPAQLLDIYRPRSAPRPLPVLLYIHGGAFVICSKDTHHFLAMANAERAGYLVFCINYRLAPDHKFPAAIEDACDAYCWVVRNAARYGGDPQRIVVAGESAGGNLALGVAIAAAYKRPEAYAQRVYALNVAPAGVMPLMPFLQVSSPERRTADPGASALGLAVARYIATAYLDDAPPSAQTLMADPIRILEECPAPQRKFAPVFAGVGTADVCCADVRRLEAACTARRIPVQAIYYPDEFHVFHTMHWRSAARAFWTESVEFMLRLARLPKTTAVPPVRHSSKIRSRLEQLLPARLAAGIHKFRPGPRRRFQRDGALHLG